MATPTYAPGDQVQFAAGSPFYDGVPMIVLGIQYLTENGEFTDEVTDYFQYRLGVYQTSSVEQYIEPVPGA